MLTKTPRSPLVGHVPAVELIKDQVKTDEDGYIVTVPGTSQTSVQAVFAAGDVQVRLIDYLRTPFFPCPLSFLT